VAEPGVVVDTALADFIGERCTLILSAAADSGVPDLCMALAVWIEAETGRLTLVLDARNTQAMQSLVRAGCSEVALVACRPSDLRTFQIKGHQPSIQMFPATGIDSVSASTRSRREELDRIGFGGAYAATLYDFDPSQLVCLSFEPHVVFEQTPGPRAGQAIGGGA